MGTTGIIAVPHGDSWRGRYNYSDGYPQWLGRHLWAIVQRDGTEKARKVLTEDYFGWSMLDSTQGTELRDKDPRKDIHVAVEGYGTAYTSEDQPDEWWTPEQLEPWDWGYVLGDDALWIIKGSTFLGSFPWNSQEPHWQTIEEGAYA